MQRYSRRVQQWEHILPQAFHAVLLSQIQHGNRRWPALLLATASLCLSLALSQPYWAIKQEQIDSPQVDPLVFVIQLTPESLASDLAPNRLQRIQHKIMQLIRMHEQGKAAIVVYAGSTHTLVPLSNDQQAIHNLLYALHPSLMPVAGQNAALAIERASQLITQSGHQQGQILLFSYGLTSSEQRAISAQIRTSKHRLSILGVGSTQGAPITDTQTGQLTTDRAGNILISQLDEQSLQRFSRKNNLAYARITQTNQDIEKLDLSLNQRQHLTQTNAAIQNNQGYWFVLPLLLLLAPLARRGWLLLLLCAYLVAPPNSMATPFTQLSPLQRVQADPERALHTFDDPMWQAIAAYHNQNYLLAIDYFSQLDSAAAFYNAGNAYMQLHDYAQAIINYETALNLEPELSYAADNLLLAQELLNQQTNAEQQNTTEAEPEQKDEAPLSISAQLSTAGQQQDPNTQDTPIRPVITDMEAWLKQIPDNPGELLRRKFWYEQFGTGAP